MKIISVVFISLFFIYTCLGAGHHVFETRYPLSVTLVDNYYFLYWNYSISDQTIQFAVKVNTTGWVGFGISGDGRMIGSDVVIGWVDGDNAYFHDRYAEEYSEPPIDNSQDWFLISAAIHDGYTELEFSRNFTTCDNDSKDLTILPETFYAVYSWNDNKPTVTRDRDGESYTLMPHQQKGSVTVNLLGELPNPPAIPNNAKEFTLAMSNVQVPPTTFTYWCKGFDMEDLFDDEGNNTKYIIEYGPTATQDYVYNMLVVGCNGLGAVDLAGGNCFALSQAMALCLRGLNIAGWSVGGESVLFPKNVAQPIGKEYGYQFFVLLVHYDNPNALSNIVDSSGMYFKYISEPREHNAGLLEIGHQVSERLAVPPGVMNYTARSFCSQLCTESFIPESGITIFANAFHTRSEAIGVSLTVVRADKDGKYNEVAWIEKNLQYYEHFQQTTFLPEKVVVKPGDILLTSCFYDTSTRDTALFGGYSTQEDICLSFVSYYPSVDWHRCLSRPLFNGLDNFTNTLPTQYRAAFDALEADHSRTNLATALNQLTWTETLADAFEEAVYASGQQFSYCYNETEDEFEVSGRFRIPAVSQYYTPPPPVRECPVGDRGDGASFIHVSMIVLILSTVSSFLWYTVGV